MASIRAIETQSVHRIQSGQVIVDLCSVVKELVENCLDAAATTIEIRFKNSGLDSIEVQDNGSGIRKEDFDTIALKHYTSKLSNYDDIASLTTFGFRGEALSSLCALTRFHIVTAREDEAPRGTRLDFALTGQLDNTSISASPKGTTVTVDDIFYNVPVRRQELRKNIKREYGKALNLLHAYACISTGVRVVVSNQMPKGKRVVVFSTAMNIHIAENIANVYGSKTIQALIPLQLKLSDDHPTTSMANFEVTGFISKPMHGEGRQTPDRQMFFVNSRPCLLPQVAKAFNEVYRSYNTTQSPFILANVSLDTNAYDVNVSPDKKTILLHDQAELLNLMKEKLTEFFHGETILQTQIPANDSHIKMRGSNSAHRDRQNIGTVLKDCNLSPRSTSGHNDRVESSPDASCLLETSHSLELDDASSTASATSSRHTVQVSQLQTKINATAEDTLAHTNGKSIDILSSSPSPSLQVDQRPADANNDDGAIQSKLTLEAINNVTNASFQLQNQNTTSKNEESPSSSTQRKPGENKSCLPAHSNESGKGSKSRQSSTVPRSKLNKQELSRGSRAERIASTKCRRIHIPNEHRHSQSDSDQTGNISSQGHIHSPSHSVSPTSRSIGIDEITIETKRKSSLPSTTAISPIFGSPRGLRESSPPAMHQSGSYHNEYSQSAEEEPEDPHIFDPIIKRKQEEYRIQEMIRRAEDSFTNPPRTNRSRGVLLSTNTNAPRKESTMGIMFRLKTSDVITKENLNTMRGLITTPNPGRKLVTERTATVAQASQSEITKEALTAEERLSLTVSKSDFGRMRVVGQFNLGFILAIRSSVTTHDDEVNPSALRRTASEDLFIIDQHASDEIYNFHKLSETTTLTPQPLVRPQTLELTAVEEEIVMSYNDTGGILMKNGFRVDVDTTGKRPVGRRCSLLTLPTSRETVFDIRDLEELLVSLGESSTSTGAQTLRPSKVRRMLAMRACRSSIMVGKHLTKTAMHSVLQHMGEIERPWNCPHGRPTMRHLAWLDHWRKWQEADGFMDEVAELEQYAPRRTANWSNFIEQDM